MTNIIPVVFCFDKRIVLGASVAIKSLIDCAKDTTTYDIRVFHSDLDIENQKNITKLLEGTRHNIAFHYIAPEIFKGAPHNAHSWTKVVYYRFLVPYLLPEYSRAIYSDVDVLFKNDLSELYETNIDNYIIGAVAGERNNQNYLKECTNEDIFMSGLILFNCEKYLSENILQKLLDNAVKYQDKLKMFDLDLMNITINNIYKLHLKYCLIQDFLYVTDYKTAAVYKSHITAHSDNEIKEAFFNPAIIHYAGKPGKPWRMKHPYKDYQEFVDKLPKSLKKYTFRDLRKKIFSKV